MSRRRTRILVAGALLATLPALASAQLRAPSWEGEGRDISRAARAGDGESADGIKTVTVNCPGKSINNELGKHKGKELILEINGICEEDVVIQRDRVTLIGTDPATDGIRGVDPTLDPGNAIVKVQESRIVRIENLSIADGGRNGIQLERDSGPIEIVNCVIENTARDGIQVNSNSFARITGSTIQNHGRSAIAGFGGDLILCDDCDLGGANNGILLVSGTRASVSDSDVSGSNFGILSFNGGSSTFIDNSDVAGGNWSLGASDMSTIVVTGGTLDGSMIGELGSYVQIQGGAEQTNSTTGFNYFDGGSNIRVSGGSAILGDQIIDSFAEFSLSGSSSVDGNLFCSLGGDAACDDPGDITGTSSCGTCPVP